MLETSTITEMRRHYDRAHALRAQAFRDILSMRWLRSRTKKRAAISQPVVNACPV